MTLPFWKATDSLWDVLYLDDIRIPGISALDIAPERKVKKEHTKDSNGVTLVDEGYLGAKVKGEVRLWTYQQLLDFELVYPFLNPKNVNGVSRPLAVTHPMATLLGITQIYAPKWSFDQPRSADDSLIIKFEAEQWFPQPKEKPKTGPSPNVQPPNNPPQGGGDSEDGKGPNVPDFDRIPADPEKAGWRFP